MKLSFHGGAGGILTGANYLLETGKTRILVDCGMFQGSREAEAKNREPFPYDPETADFVLITHAHLDHIGRLPRLVSEGFKGRILATAPTIDFARLILEDGQKILEEKARRAGVPPLITPRHVEEVMERFEPVEYGQAIKLGKEITACFKDAGHVLGSAFIEIESEKKKVVFSGDLGDGRTPILKKPAAIGKVDYVFLESTYGHRLHEDIRESEKVIQEVIKRTVEQGGVLMIPTFALERTQRLLYHFNHLVEDGHIKPIPFFVDSPLAIKMTDVYRKYPKYYGKKADLLLKSDSDIFKFPGLKLTLSTRESKAINDTKPPKIILAGAGMSCGGRIIHHEARYLSDPKNILLIVTYQAEGTLGRRLLEGARRVEILDRPVRVRAQVEHVNGYSSHADQNGLLTWLKPLTETGSKPGPEPKVFVVHGEEKASSMLAQKIKADLGMEAQVPQLGQTIEL